MSNNSNQLPQIQSTEESLLIQRKLALMIKQKEKIIDELNSKLNEKDVEISKLKEANKTIEKKNEEIFKNCTQINITDISEIKNQFEYEKLLLNEMIKTLNNDINKKNDQIQKLTNELSTTRSLIEIERKINQKYFVFKDQYQKTDINFHKISCENTTLKSNLFDSQEKIQSLEKEIDNLKNENKNLNEQIEKIKIKFKEKFNLIKNSYNNLINDYNKLNEILNKSKEEICTLSNENNNLSIEIENVQNENIKINKEKIEISSDNEGIKKRMQLYAYENEDLKKEIKSLKKELFDIKLSKQVFYITYYYMKMQMNGNFTIEKKENNFYFIIEKKSMKRTLEVKDVELFKDNCDNNKINVKILKENVTEEYYSNEADKIIDTFNYFKTRYMENNDIQSEEERKKMEEESDKKSKEQINKFIGII